MSHFEDFQRAFPPASAPARPALAYPDPELARLCVFIGADGQPTVIIDGVDRTGDLSRLIVDIGPGMRHKVDASFTFAPRRQG